MSFDLDRVKQAVESGSINFPAGLTRKQRREYVRKMMSNYKVVELITCDAGDWEVLKLNGDVVAQGHSIRNDDWLGLLSSFEGVTVQSNEVSDEEILALSD